MTWIVSMIGGTCVKRLPYYHVYLRSWSTVKFLFHLLAGWGSTDATWAGGYHSGYHHSKGKLGKQGESHSATISCPKLICAGLKGLWKSSERRLWFYLALFCDWLKKEWKKKTKKKKTNTFCVHLGRSHIFLCSDRPTWLLWFWLCDVQSNSVVRVTR